MKVQAFVTFQSSNATFAVALAIGITSFGWVGHWSIRIAIAIIYKNKLKLLKCKKILISNTLIQNSCQSSRKQEEGSEDYQAELYVHVDQLRTYQTLKHRLESHRTRNFRNNINLYFMKWKTRSINLKSMRCNNWGPFLRVAKTRILMFLQDFSLKCNAHSEAL